MGNNNEDDYLGGFALGDVVALKSERYELRDKNNIWRNLISPYMTIIEIASDLSNDYEAYHDEFTGTEIRKNCQARCLWFSQKLGAFEDRWFYVEMLKKVEKQDENDIIPRISYQPYSLNDSEHPSKIGDVVSIKTIFYEYSVKKDVNGKPIIDISPFFPASMTVKEISRIKEKIPTHDKKSGLRNRLINNQNEIKCIWFNSNTHKFQEGVFSPEILIKLDASSWL